MCAKIVVKKMHFFRHVKEGCGSGTRMDHGFFKVDVKYHLIFLVSLVLVGFKDIQPRL